MKLFRNHKKLAVAGLALTVALFAGGAAFAYFTTTGTGVGGATVGSGSTVSITQLDNNTQTSYSSVISPPTPDYWGLSYGGTSTTDLGNKVNLVSSTGNLENVVVELDSQACESGSGTSCTTTPGATFTSDPITVTIYNSTESTVLATDTETFNIPYRPSAAAVANPSKCTTGTDNWASPAYLNDGSQWYDPATNNCYFGILYTATFSNFSFTGSHVLPSTVIYGISYSPSGSDPTSSLNVELSNESTNISVGSDADPGNLFLTSTGAAQGTGGQITCSITTAGFNEYSTAAGAGGCGAQTPDNPGQIADIPQVEINTASGGGFPALVPGGPAEPVDFSIDNTGTSPAYIQTVTFAITPADVTTLNNAGCSPSWFTLVQPTTPLDVTIPAGATVPFQPSGGSISLINEPFSQNACENLAVSLTFTANTN
jgi:hypothetical protein